VYFGDNFDTVNNATGAPPQTKTTYDPGPLGFEKVYYWRVDESDGSAMHKGDVWCFITMRSGSGVKGQYYKDKELKNLVLTRVDPGINFNWGTAAPDPIVGADNFSVRWTGELEVPFTSPWTFTTNCDDCVRLWVNNQKLIDGWGQQSGVEWTGTINLTEGQKYSIVMEYYENTGDAYAMLYWNSPYWLSPYQPKQIIPQGAFSLPLRAGSPNPANGATDVRDIPTLSWAKGDTADKHDVYFGTDQAAVEGATTATAGIYRGQQALDATTYTPTEAPLEWGKTYYWRIDEVEADGVTIHKGNLWSFTVAEFFIVEDFESYNDLDTTDPASNRIFNTWIDGYGTTTNGSIVGYENPPFCEQTIVHGGKQSMPFSYSNTAGKTYSEAERTFTVGQDWTKAGSQTLVLFFRGTAGNTGQLYVKVNGSKVVYGGDASNIAKPQWTQWNIDLASLGVNLQSVTKLAVGVDGNGASGKLYFDDIRLYALAP